MSVHLTRAQLLLQQSRPADAEREAGLAVAQTPDHPQAHALLALSRLELKKHALSLMAARAALSLAPDSAYYHYIHSLVLHRSENNKDALTALQEAIRLDPEDADNFSLLAAIWLNLGDWPAALTAAEQALALNPEHTEAANFRAMALVRLGRKDEAVATVDSALEQDPESAFSHANQGWNCLHRNDPKRALEHFKEALRLDPNLEYAREGMLEALKARNWIYRQLLAYFLWSGRLSSGRQWALIAGCYVASRFVAGLAESHPGPKLLWWAILLPLYGFIYLTWTAQPLFNLFLRLDRFGRYILTPQQRLASNWYAPFFFATVGALVWMAVADTDVAFFSMFFLAALSICVASTFARQDRHRLVLGAATVLLAAFAVLALTPSGPAARIPNGFTLYFVYGFLGFQLLANLISIQRR